MKRPKLPKGVHVVRGAGGQEYCYAWRGGPRVMSKVGSPAFFAELKLVGALPDQDRAMPKPIRLRFNAAPKEPNLADRLRLDPDKTPDLTHLYRHYGFDGRLLYVGITRSTVSRWYEHSKRGGKSSWIDEVAVITVDHYATRAEAEDAEAAAIFAERPLFNRVVRLAQRKVA